MNALQLFHSGLDYIAIGVILNIHESEVEKRIHALRKAEWAKFTAQTNEPKPTKRLKKIGYAGRENVSTPGWGR